MVFKIFITFDPAFILKYHKDIIFIEAIIGFFYPEIGNNLNVPKGTY